MPVLPVLAALALATPLAGQRSALREVHETAKIGGGFVLGLPEGSFGRAVEAAGGLSGFGTVNLDPHGVLGLRIEGGFLIYGADHGVLLTPYYPVGVNTTYSIASLGIGPQVTLGEGPLKVYGFGTAGLSYFFASSSYNTDACGCDGISGGIDFGDLNPAFQAGGGILLQVSRNRHNPTYLDIGARYVWNGETSYVQPGTMITDPYGPVIRPVRTDANLVQLHIGVSISIN